MTKAGKNAGLPENVTDHSVRKTCISTVMDAEIPVNYVAQRSGHTGKNLKSLDSYKTASDDHQRKMSLLLSSETKSPISSNDVPLNQAVKASQHPVKPREDKQASSGEDPFTDFFAGSNISKIEGCTFKSLSIQRLAAVVKARLGQSRKNATLSSQMTQTQINLNLLLES